MYKRVFVMGAMLGAMIFVDACSVAGHKGTKKIVGVWAVEPIVIDGSSNDWHTPYPNYDDKAMLGYAVSNDSENLYITVETGDAATQLKILEGGLTVWIDKSGTEKEVTAINYPIPAVYKGKQHNADGTGYARAHIADQDPGANVEVQKRLIEMQQNVKKTIEAADEYSLQGFKGCNLQFPIKAENSCGIVVRMSMDQDNELIWEAKIPFGAFYFKSKVDRSDMHRQINICFETTGSKRPAGQTAGNARVRGRGGFRPSIGIGGMGMGMSFGNGGGGNQGSPYDPNANLMESLYKSTKTWTKVGIAIK